MVSILFRFLRKVSPYLDIISLMIVAAFTEESVMHNAMDVQLVEEGIAILKAVSWNLQRFKR
jgi:hypothetical protein